MNTRIYLAFLIAIIIVIAGIFFIKNHKSYKYKVIQGSHTYYTDYINRIENNCINFQSGCGCSDKKNNITICGDYTVITK